MTRLAALSRLAALTLALLLAQPLSALTVTCRDDRGAPDVAGLAAWRDTLATADAALAASLAGDWTDSRTGMSGDRPGTFALDKTLATDGTLTARIEVCLEGADCEVTDRTGVWAVAPAGEGAFTLVTYETSPARPDLCLSVQLRLEGDTLFFAAGDQVFLTRR